MDLDRTIELSLNQPSNLSWGQSQSVIGWLITQSGWRVYTSIKHKRVPHLMKRFFYSHGQVNITGVGGKPARIHHTEPIERLYFQQGRAQVRGLLWANGAIVVTTSPEHSTFALFVDEETARKWAYPNEYDTAPLIREES